jgi:hypothetical protein
MLEKNEILLVLIILFFIFYVVISLGASKSGKTHQNKDIKKYLFGVRILILIVALVSLFFWFLM